MHRFKKTYYVFEFAKNVHLEVDTRLSRVFDSHRRPSVDADFGVQLL